MTIGNALAKLGGKAQLAWKAHGATACLVAGMGGMITSGVLAAKGWVKCQRIIDQKNEDITRINETINQVITLQDGTQKAYTQEDANKDLAATRRSTAFGIAKEMALPVGLAVASGGLVVYSHVNLKGKVASMTAYASAIEAQLSQYRVRVANRVGKEEENMIWNGYHKETVVETKTDPETGEVTNNVVEQIVKDADLDIPSNNEINIVFDRHCHDFNSKSREMNLSTVSIIFRNLEDRMNIRDFVELREIYDEFGTPAEDRLAAETILGCVRDDSNPDSGLKWSVVDYGIDPHDPEILINVKIDGVILKKLSDLRKKGQLGKYDNYNNPKRLYL